MTKTINCSRCGRCIKVEGISEGSKLVSQEVTCPYCRTPNQVDWPMGAGYKVGRCDGDEIPEPEPTF